MSALWSFLLMVLVIMAVSLGAVSLAKHTQLGTWLGI